MKILIADDDDVQRLRLESMLTKRGYEVIPTADGKEAWDQLSGGDPPCLAILDWMMTDMDGIEVCRRVRANPALRSTYLILLTSRESKESVIEGLQAGANDYITKPFDPDELHARLSVGLQMVQLQNQLAERVRELEQALNNVKQLQGLLPICSYCKSIRDDQDYWHRVESYITQRTDARLSHGICPTCWKKIVAPELSRFQAEQTSGEQKA